LVVGTAVQALTEAEGGAPELAQLVYSSFWAVGGAFSLWLLMAKNNFHLGAIAIEGYGEVDKFVNLRPKEMVVVL
jgi:hypothetical protein